MPSHPSATFFKSMSGRGWPMVVVAVTEMVRMVALGTIPASSCSTSVRSVSLPGWRVRSVRDICTRTWVHCTELIAVVIRSDIPTLGSTWRQNAYFKNRVEVSSVSVRMYCTQVYTLWILAGDHRLSFPRQARKTCVCEKHISFHTASKTQARTQIDGTNTRKHASWEYAYAQAHASTQQHSPTLHTEV